MPIIAFLTEATPLQCHERYASRSVSLSPIAPPPIASACGPPAWDDDSEPLPDWNLIAQPDPGF